MIIRLRVLYIIALVIVVQITSNAQTVRLINATEQDWAGGIAGHTGENYTFEIEFSDYGKEPIPTTLWVGRYAFRLTTNVSLVENNTVIKRYKKINRIRVAITVGTSRNEYAEREGQPTENDILNGMPKPPKLFKGKALLAYRYMGEMKTIEVVKIMNNLPMQDLP